MADVERKMKEPGAVWNMICAQERAMIAEVEAIRISKKPEVIGALFEDSFRDFLRKLIPSSLHIVPGFIVEQNGKESSHFDVLLVDNSYPFLSSVGPHRYVMSSSVVAVVELTTKLDKAKLTSVLSKSAEIECISLRLYKSFDFGNIGFYSFAIDALVPNSRIMEEFARKKPWGHLYALRESRKQDGIHCWMEGGKNGKAHLRSTVSPLADFVSMQLQDSIYSLASRIRDGSTIGEKMCHYIRWGTIRWDVSG